MSIKLQQIGVRIRKARKERKLSQFQLAEMAQVSPSHISDIENGKTNVGIDVFMRITEALQVSADWLLQTDIPEVTHIINGEVADLLADCTPGEAQAIVQTIENMKSALHDAKRKD